MAKIIMIQGTMSNVGKSVLTAGLCRVFKKDGYRVAPFKSQNMALNSYITEKGEEMGRAQVVQAEACGEKPDVRMNPILLKPTNDTGSQVILNGKVLGHMSARHYFKNKLQFKKDILNALYSLAEEFDIIVIEGAGSPAEINLNQQDIVNMGLAQWINAPVLLVGDIDRGGVFASLFGTISLLKAEEQAHIKGLIINKFRGDLELLKPGISQFEAMIPQKILGVIPFVPLELEDEDSLSPQLQQKSHENLLDIAVIHLPKISNFTDFTALSTHDVVGLRYVQRLEELKNPDLIIIPGSKNTIADLLWMRQNGLETAIKKLVDQKTPLLGICGGFQMLGESLSDPEAVEHGGNITGFQYLPTKTIFSTKKKQTQVQGIVENLNGFFASLSESTFTGYEIHMGETSKSSESFSKLNTSKKEGAVKDHVMGTYVHGLFDEGTFSTNLIELLCVNKGIQKDSTQSISYQDYKEQQYQSLENTLREHLDIKKIYELLEELPPREIET